MKKIYLAIVTSAILSILPYSAHAENELTANVGFTNNYLWRDLEQSNGDAAVSGGIDYASDTGFYLGTWVSNSSWSEGMTYELDFYGGYSSEYQNVSYDIGFVHYSYPDSIKDVDFTEFNVSFSYSVFSFSYAVLANAEDVDFADDSYISLAADFEIMPEVNLTMHVAKGTDEFYAGESFIGYGMSLSKDGFTLGLSKTDLANTDMKVFISYSIDMTL